MYIFHYFFVKTIFSFVSTEWFRDGVKLTNDNLTNIRNQKEYM